MNHLKSRASTGPPTYRMVLVELGPDSRTWPFWPYPDLVEAASPGRWAWAQFLAARSLDWANQTLSVMSEGQGLKVRKPKCRIQIEVRSGNTGI